jgi:hypothetical protein
VKISRTGTDPVEQANMVLEQNMQGKNQHSLVVSANNLCALISSGC